MASESFKPISTKMDRAARKQGHGVMPRQGPLMKGFFRFITLFLVLFFFGGSQTRAERADYRLLFTGDVLLSREVIREINGKGGQSPWSQMGDFFKQADWVVGNLEGSVG